MGAAPNVVLVLPDADAVARRAAEIVAAAARARGGAFHLAVSGGSTPRRMFAALATLDVPWERLHVWQVDERIAPAGHPDRNLTLLEQAGLGARARVHAMPVESADLAAAAASYADELSAACGGVLDLVHLGLGADGHTASLVPGDAALESTADVAISDPYQGRRRMTLTLPALRRARAVLWVVTGADKAPVLARFWAADSDVIGSRVSHPNATLVCDVLARP